MELARVVELVDQVRATSKKTQKIALLADFLQQLRGREIELAAHYLAGTLPQGKIGVGWRMIQEAMAGAVAAGAPLVLADLDQTFAAIASGQGAGSSGRKISLLRRLFERAAANERQ